MTPLFVLVKSFGVAPFPYVFPSEAVQPAKSKPSTLKRFVRSTFTPPITVRSGIEPLAVRPAGAFAANLTV